MLSELTRKQPAQALVEWVNTQDEEHCFLSVLTLGEIRKGIDLLLSSRKKTFLQNWLNIDLRARFEDRILDVDVEVAERWGADCARAQALGRVIPVVDGLIAATAAVHGLTVVTRNTQDMAVSGVPLVNPWES